MGCAMLAVLLLLASALSVEGSVAAYGEIATVDVYSTELFILPIDSQKMFGWARQDSLGGAQFSYRPSISGYPDLPHWAQYAHDEHDGTGYVFGVPPNGHDDVMLEIIGLNRATYEVQRSQVMLQIHPKRDQAIAQIQLKIDNLDVLDLMDQSRMERLLEVFRRYLWPEAATDIYITFMTSAVRLGARLPLKPDEKEGVVIYVGSSMNASQALRNLETELEPLSRSIVSASSASTSMSFPSIGGCPRDFRRASVDRLFRERGFHVDWCAFRLMAWEPAPHIGASPPRMAGDVGLVAGRRRRPLQRPMTPPPRPSLDAYLSNAMQQLDPALQLPLDAPKIWSQPSISEIPVRSYANEMVMCIGMPIMAFVALTALLSMILCLHHDAAKDDSSVHFESVFDFCDDLWRDESKYHEDCQRIHYEAVQRAPSKPTLRSLSRPREFQLCHESPTDIARLSGDRDIGGRPLPPPYHSGTNRSAKGGAYMSADARGNEPKTWFC